MFKDTTNRLQPQQTTETGLCEFHNDSYDDVNNNILMFTRNMHTKIHVYRLVRNPGRDVYFPILSRKEIETRKLERKSKQQISRLNDLLFRLNDTIGR